MYEEIIYSLIDEGEETLVGALVGVLASSSFVEEPPINMAFSSCALPHRCQHFLAWLLLVLFYLDGSFLT